MVQLNRKVPKRFTIKPSWQISWLSPFWRKLVHEAFWKISNYWNPNNTNPYINHFQHTNINKHLYYYSKVQTKRWKEFLSQVSIFKKRHVSSLELLEVTRFWKKNFPKRLQAQKPCRKTLLKLLKQVQVVIGQMLMVLTACVKNYEALENLWH